MQLETGTSRTPNRRKLLHEALRATARVHLEMITHPISHLMFSYALSIWEYAYGGDTRMQQQHIVHTGSRGVTHIILPTQSGWEANERDDSEASHTVLRRTTILQGFN